jgi:SAM-dependent methyltransferase
VSGLAYYARLLRQGTSRIGAFRTAIEGVVGPGDRVLDVGTGLGTFAFFAARAGADEVWAVDRDPVVHLARELAAVNDPRGVVRFLHGALSEVETPGAFDVALFEDFPVGLVDPASHRLLRAVGELLGPDGVLLPDVARLSMAPATLEGSGTHGIPTAVGEESFGLDLGLLRSRLANEPRQAHLPEGALRGRPVSSGPLPLLPPPSAARLSVAGSWTAASAGRVDALLVWFDLHLPGAGWISNAPGPGAEPWGQLVLPVDPPLRVGAGGRLEAEAGPEAEEGGAPGWWRWRVHAGGELREGHQFASVSLSPDRLPDPADPPAGAPP